MIKYLIVGLGNLGDEYAHTRHNIGFDVVTALVQKHNGSFKQDRLAFTSTIKVKGKTIVCIMPTTFMNLSGKAVKYWMDKEKIELTNMLVILDELAIPINKLRLRPSGSSGGHNGLKDIEAVLQTNNYARLRFGIGNDYPKGKQVDYVLGKWLSSEELFIKKKIELSVQVIEDFILTGIDIAMNKVNKLEITL